MAPDQERVWTHLPRLQCYQSYGADFLLLMLGIYVFPAFVNACHTMPFLFLYITGSHISPYSLSTLRLNKAGVLGEWAFGLLLFFLCSFISSGTALLSPAFQSTSPLRHQENFLPAEAA